jgi:hypothetical protein
MSVHKIEASRSKEVYALPRREGVKMKGTVLVIECVNFTSDFPVKATFTISSLSRLYP